MAYSTPRAFSRTPVTFRVGMSSHILQGLEARDLSPGGLGVRVPQPIPVQSAIVVALGDDVRVNATVKHCTKGSEGFLVGAQFGALTEGQRSAIRQILDQVTGQ